MDFDNNNQRIIYEFIKSEIAKGEKIYRSDISYRTGISIDIVYQEIYNFKGKGLIKIDEDLGGLIELN